MRKSLQEKNKSKIQQYSITQIQVHQVDQLGLSCPAKLRKNIVWTLEHQVGAGSEHCLCRHQDVFPKAYARLWPSAR